LAGFETLGIDCAAFPTVEVTVVSVLLLTPKIVERKGMTEKREILEKITKKSTQTIDPTKWDQYGLTYRKILR